jgi:hypothetical protein
MGPSVAGTVLSVSAVAGETTCLPETIRNLQEYEMSA